MGKELDNNYANWDPVKGTSRRHRWWPTIRLMEELLENGRKDIVIDKAHGGENITYHRPRGGYSNTSGTLPTTLGTPHNGSEAADKFGKIQ